MYIYNLSVAIANKSFSFEECPAMIELIKRSIVISNSSFSASRYKRNIQYRGLIDDKHIQLVMTSRDEMNPTRSLSSISRAMVAIDKEEGTNLLEGCTVSGCLFKAMVINAPQTPLIADDLTDDMVLKHVIDIVYSSDPEAKQKLKEFLLPYINNGRE